MSATSSPEGSPSPLMTLAITCPLHRAIKSPRGRAEVTPERSPVQCTLESSLELQEPGTTQEPQRGQCHADQGQSQPAAAPCSSTAPPGLGAGDTDVLSGAEIASFASRLVLPA